MERLGELNALGEVGNTSIIALKSSNTEYFIPKAFAVIFFGVFLALAMIVALNWPPSRLVAAPPPAISGTGNAAVTVTAGAGTVTSTAATPSTTQPATRPGSTKGERP